MQEIAAGVYMSTEYIGATVGMIVMERGSVYIDSPPCPDQARTWRNTVRSMTKGPERALVYLDHRTDRALGGRLMDCPIIAHEQTAHIFRSRSAIFRAQPNHQGEAWETCPNINNVRWSPIHLSFDRELRIHWGPEPLLLEYHPGPAPGAIWALLPETRVVFVGDTVTLREPPFLAQADPSRWLEALDELLAPAFQDFLVVAGRGGLAPQSEIRHMRRFIEEVHRLLSELAEGQAPVEEAEALTPQLIAWWEFPPTQDKLFTQRLAYGLRACYQEHYLGTR